MTLETLSKQVPQKERLQSIRELTLPQLPLKQLLTKALATTF